MPIESSGLDAKAVKIHNTDQVYNGYAKVNELTFSYPKFDDTISEPVKREIFVSGDAAVVIPFDPELQPICLIEQLRMGPLVNGEHPWIIEAIAGRIDKGHEAAEVAKLEAREEAGCELIQLVEIGTFYQSPGIFAERITYFIAHADLSSVGGIHGLETENEDIRAFCASLKDALKALADGRIVSAPTALCLLALKDRRDELTRLWRS